MKDYVIAFIIASLIFLVGLLLGLQISYYKGIELEGELKTFERFMESTELTFLLSGANKNLSCNYLSYEAEKLSDLEKEMKKIVVAFEETSQIKTESYKNIKREYMLVRVKYWLLLEKIRGECNSNFLDILFFYDTSYECEECREQGLVLSYLAEKLKGKLYVVPIDRAEDLGIIQFLTEYYNITKVPSIIINGNKKIEGFRSLEELKNLFCEDYNICKKGT